MIFDVQTARYAYKPEDAEKLKELGFEFEEIDEGIWIGYRGRVVKKKKSVSVEIKSLEELLSLIKTHGQIILDIGEIWIYDDYIE